MKLFTAIAATVLLGSGAASFAADTAPTPSASPPTKVAAAMSHKACNKEANARKLKGTDRSQFVKDCRAGKVAS
jgi:hypothetical protein